MILGVGTDVLALERFERLCRSLDLEGEAFMDDPFFLRSFTSAERAQALTRDNPKVFMATRFAGKEAVYKSISVCGCSFLPHDIEIVDRDDGKPSVCVAGKTSEMLARFSAGTLNVQISLSYETDYATAVAVAELDAGAPCEQKGFEMSKPNKTKELVSGAIISGLACGILGFAVGGFVVPFPANVIANAIGQAICGVLSGVVTAIVTTLLLFKKFENDA